MQATFNREVNLKLFGKHGQGHYIVAEDAIPIQQKVPTLLG